MSFKRQVDHEVIVIETRMPRREKGGERDKGIADDRNQMLSQWRRDSGSQNVVTSCSEKAQGEMRLVGNCLGDPRSQDETGYWGGGVVSVFSLHLPGMTR